MSDNEDFGVRVTMRESSESDAAGDEWDDGFDEGGKGGPIDAEALKELRSSSNSDDASAVAAAFQDAADEFGSAPATVMENVEELSATGLLEMVDAGGVGGGKNADFDEDSVTVMDPRAMGALPTPDDSIGKEACPSCGVMVAPGYPKCPRCKHVLIATGTRDPAKAGGTTVVGRTVPWAIVFVAAVFTAIIVYLAERDPVVDNAKSDTAESRPASTGPEGEPQAEPNADDVEDDDVEDEAALDLIDAG